MLLENVFLFLKVHKEGTLPPSGFQTLLCKDMTPGSDEAVF